MTHSQKLLTFVLLLFLASLSGCGPVGEEKKFVIGFSQCTEGDAWRKAMHEEMEREASFYPELSQTGMLKIAAPLSQVTSGSLWSRRWICSLFRQTRRSPLLLW